MLLLLESFLSSVPTDCIGACKPGGGRDTDGGGQGTDGATGTVLLSGIFLSAWITGLLHAFATSVATVPLELFFGTSVLGLLSCSTRNFRAFLIKSR